MAVISQISKSNHRFLQCFALACGLITAVGCTKKTPSSDTKELHQSLQVLLVETTDWNANRGTAQKYERNTLQEPFHAVGNPLPVWVGRNGLAWPSETGAPPAPRIGLPVKQEGDGRSPAGLLQPGVLWGYASQAPPQIRWPYQAVDEWDRCVDDMASSDYAQMRRAPLQGPPPWKSDEHMRLPTDHYKYALVLKYNMTTPRPGSGSCIFLHVAPPPGKPTAGCTALAENDLIPLLQWLDPAKHPMLIQVPVIDKALVQQAWHLPKELGMTQTKATAQ